jgi:two-component system cell cycle sensor histidine kinase/response regulator CckA
MAPRDVLRSRLQAVASIGTGHDGSAVPTESTDIYRDLLDSLDAISWEADPETLQFTLVSPKAEALLGHPQSAWTSNPTFWTDIIHPDDRQRALDTRVEAVKRCEDHRADYRVITADGRTRWIRDTVRLKCEDGQPTRMYGVMIDVTASQEQQQREVYYRALVENSADAIALLDRDGTIRFVTESLERISDVGADALIGTNALECVHPEDLPRVRKALEDCVRQSGNRVAVEYRARNGGSSQHHEAIGVNRLDDPTIRAIVVNCRDITDRKRTEGALVESQRAFMSSFDEAPIGIVHTSLEGRWIRVNRRLSELLGYAPEELMATSFMAITHPDDVEQDTRALTQLLTGAMRKYECEKRYRHKDGHYVSAKLTAVLHRDSAGAPKYFISTIEDATDRIRLEGELRQGQKMEAIGRLAGGIAHDFNNLLTIIIGYTDLVLQQLAPDTPVHSDVEEIRHAGASASALTRQLLAFSRKQILQPQILDLNGIVSRMNAMLRRLIGEDIELTTRLATPLDRIWADPGQIEQIILNLALNARDAMPYGGSLTVETANADLDAHWVAQHPDASEGRHVMLVLSDTGIGMDETVKAHLFEPFFTTKERGKGTGLGLATVYGIVKQSGGSIFVHSQPAHGTTFNIFLPRTERSVDLPNAPRPAPQSPGGTETILLVEDQPEVRAVTRDAMARHGDTVLEAANGAEAVSILKNHVGEVRLLLTDVVMPGMSGRDLAEQLVAGRPDLRVLYTSGYTDDAIVHHGVLEAGMAFIQKPFTPHELLQKIRDLLDAR